MISIREAGPGDAAAISALMNPVAARQISADFPQEGKDSLHGGMTPSAVADNMLRGYRYFVASENQQFVGIIGMRGYSHIYHLFVAEDRQGRGIGRRLLQHARDMSLSEIELSAFTVFSSELAEDFYRRLGFERTGPTKTKRGVKAVPMRLILK